MKNLLFVPLIALSLIIGYSWGSWWKFIPSTFLILALTKIFFPKMWLEFLGLKFKEIEVLGAILLCVIFYFIARFMILWSLPPGYDLAFGYDGWGSMLLITIFFQALNEELVFRGLLIQLFLYFRVRTWVIILVPGLIFSILHWVFYKYNLSQEHGGVLSFSSLVTLFMFGASATMICLKSRNILMPWALHMAWNINRFSLVKTEGSYGKINEASTFNIMEGSTSVLLLSCVLLVISYLFYQEKKSI